MKRKFKTASDAAIHYYNVHHSENIFNWREVGEVERKVTVLVLSDNIPFSWIKNITIHLMHIHIQNLLKIAGNI